MSAGPVAIAGFVLARVTLKAQGITCDNFKTQAAAQAVFDAAPKLSARLDPDSDGVACESLPKDEEAPSVSVPQVETKQRGGLGLTGKEWRDLWGDPDNEPKGKYWKAEYKRFGVVVRLLYLEDDQQEVGFDILPAAPAPRSAFTPGFERFLPEDAIQIDEYPRSIGLGTVVVYNSQWLADRFLALNDPVVDDWFPGGNPGDFVVILHEDSSGDIEQATIGLGNNP